MPSRAFTTTAATAFRTRLPGFMAADNVVRRLKTLSGQMPDEDVFKVRTSDRGRFIFDPLHQMLGRNAYPPKLRVEHDLGPVKEDVEPT